MNCKIVGTEEALEHCSQAKSSLQMAFDCLINADRQKEANRIYRLIQGLSQAIITMQKQKTF